MYESAFLNIDFLEQCKIVFIFQRKKSSEIYICRYKKNIRDINIASMLSVAFRTVCHMQKISVSYTRSPEVQKDDIQTVCKYTGSI